MTATALAGFTPAAAPAATATPTAPTAAAGPDGDTPAAAPLTWLETALAVLGATRRPMRAREIVETAAELGLTPPSRTRTPTQSVNRDLHAAVRRGDARVQVGPGAGQFRAAGVRASVPARPAPVRTAATVTVPRLPVEPLVDLVEGRGGLRACGVRHSGADSAERVRWVERVLRGYLRSRRRGWISVYDADEIAVRALGVHPCQVWDDGWWEALEDAPSAPDADGEALAPHPPELAVAG